MPFHKCPLCGEAHWHIVKECPTKKEKLPKNWHKKAEKVEGAAAPAPKKKKPGRPAGTPNKRTEFEPAKFIDNNDPLKALAAVKKMADEAGGIPRARKLLDTLEKISKDFSE